MYIHDYLVKRDLKATAQAFQAEGKVSSDPVGKLFRGVYAKKRVMVSSPNFVLFFRDVLTFL